MHADDQDLDKIAPKALALVISFGSSSFMVI